MLTFIKSLITYIAWLQKVTFLQKGTKAIYSIIEFIHNQGKSLFPRPEDQLYRCLGRVWRAATPPTHSERQSLKLGDRVGLGDVAQLVPRASSGSLGHPSSQSFAPGRQVQPRGRGLGKSSGQGEVGAHPCPLASGCRGSRGPRRTGASTCVLGGGGKKTREPSISAERAEEAVRRLAGAREETWSLPPADNSAPHAAPTQLAPKDHRRSL